MLPPPPPPPPLVVFARVLYLPGRWGPRPDCKAARLPASGLRLSLPALARQFSQCPSGSLGGAIPDSRRGRSYRIVVVYFGESRMQQTRPNQAQMGR